LPLVLLARGIWIRGGRVWSGGCACLAGSCGEELDCDMVRGDGVSCCDEGSGGGWCW